MESSPQFFQAGYYDAPCTPEKRLSDAKNGDNFAVDDLIVDFPSDENVLSADAGGFEAAMTGASTESSTVTAVEASSTAEPHFHAADIGGAPRRSAGAHFSSELCVPYDDLAELEWLSNFVEESFSSEDLQKLEMMQGMTKARPDEASVTHQYQFQPEITHPSSVLRPEVSVPAKARSKRSRTAPGNWTSRLLAVSPTPPAANLPAVSSSSESDIAATARKAAKPAEQRKKVRQDNSASGEGRKCLHCATDKTPQWRTGPMGPKTLCNACGVRYKSGRLVPEYRPAASPTFVLTKHSNSHRKVLELRRQKELLRVQQLQQQQQFLQHHHHQNMMFDVSNGDDYLIHQHIGPDFRQLI